MMNKQRWQAPGNSNIFDTDLESWQDSYITHRTILILKYIQQNSGFVSIKKFEQEIWFFIKKHIAISQNKSERRHFYRPLLFYGFIKIFDNRLFISVDGKHFLKCLMDKKYSEAKRYFILQLLKVFYPNSATERVELSLAPFRILFKLLMVNKITDRDLDCRIVYIRTPENYHHFQQIKENQYLKFRSWVISSLLKTNILTKEKDLYQISGQYLDYIKEFVDYYQDDDLFVNPQTICQKKYQVRKNLKRDRNLRNFVLKESEGKCFIDSAHKTFPTKITIGKKQYIDNYLEVHHVVPLMLQDSHCRSLDARDNLIAICPNCHRAFEKSIPENKKRLIDLVIYKGYKFCDRYTLYQSYGVM